MRLKNFKKFEEVEDTAIQVDFWKFDYNTFDWIKSDWFDTEILNLNPTTENSSLFTSIAQGQTITVVNSSIGSGIIELVNVWKNLSGSNFEILDSSNYTYEIIEENGVDALKVTYLGSSSVNLIVEYTYIPELQLTHYALNNSLNNSFIKVIVNNTYFKISMTHGINYNITGANNNKIIFYTFYSSIASKYSLNDGYFISYKGYLTEEINLVKNIILEFLDDDGLWKPIAKIPLTPTGSFDTTFFMGEGGLQFPLREERIMRLVYLPTNLTDYDNQYFAVDYSNINCVYNTSVEVEELFRLYVEGKESKLTYIPTEFSRTFDRWATIPERKYVTTTSTAETLHVGEPYTYFDFHRTITDSYEFSFQLTDEVGGFLEDQVIWMEIGWKPKSGLNYKVIDWEDENGEYIDSEALGTAWFSDEGMEVSYGPGILDYDYSVSRMYTRPESWDYFDTMANEVKQYSAYFWDYQITDQNGMVSFNVSFDEDYIEDHHVIFDESMFSSGSITFDELQDYRLYVRVFHAPVYDIGHMAYQDSSELFASKGNNVFDFDRISEFDNFSTKETAFYKGYYGEGLISVHPEDLLFGVPDLLVYQYGSQSNDIFSITVEIAEADPMPDTELMTLSKLENSFEDNELIPEFGVNNSYLIERMPVIAMITDYKGNSPFNGEYKEFIQYVQNGIVTFNISDYYMDQLIPGVYRVSFYNSPRMYTKDVYRFCTLEVRPENWLKFGEPTIRLDLLNWYDSGWGGVYFGSDYAFYEDIYPRLTGYLATDHNEPYGLEDYVEIDIFAQTRDIGTTEWSDWIEIGGEDIFISSLVYDGLYYFEYPFGQDGEMFMGKEIILNITANAYYNQTGINKTGREQNLYIMNLTLTSSSIREDAEVFRKYLGTTGESIWIGDTSSYGVERYFEYTDNVNTYGIDTDDVLLTLRGFQDIEIVEVRGLQDYDEVFLQLGTNYSVSGEPDDYNITLYTTLDNYSDLIISYAISLNSEEVVQWTFSEAEGFEHTTIILNTDSSPIILNHDNDNYLGTFYSKFNESNYIESDKTLLLDLAFSGISDDDFIIYNITDINNQEILDDLSNANIDTGRIKLTFNTRAAENINVIYGVATYKLDRGYQRIGMNMSDAVRKLSKFHNSHKIYNYSNNPETPVNLLTIPDDPQDPLEAGESKILIPLLEDNKTTITFNQLALLYDTVLNGSFYLDDTVLALGTEELSPVLATFTFITEDGESYFDYVTIDPSTGKNKFDFEISLQPIYATKGYSTIDINIDFLNYGNKSYTLQYILFDKFEFTCDDRILQVISKPMETKQGMLDVSQIINTAHYAQIFTDRLTDAYGVYNNSWMTIAVEGFEGYGELVELYKEDGELKFDYVENNEHYFQNLDSNDYRLTDSLGFHINAYDLELPRYIEGEINLYAGNGTYAYGEVYESDKEFDMNWPYSAYTVNADTFNANNYNSDNFMLTTLPITSQGAFIEGELYLHHKINLTDSNNIITSGLPPGVEFAVAMANSTSRISSLDITSIDRISRPWSWVESWQGFALTEDDYSTYNPNNAIFYNPPTTTLTEGVHYDLFITESGENQIHFNETESVIISLLASDIIQVDFHIDYEFSEFEYTLDEGANTYDVELHWKFPDASYTYWNQFEYHPDLTGTATFNASFSHLSRYAPESDFKSTYTETFQFYPNEYNFTTFEFSVFNDSEYEVTLNLTGGGEFEDIIQNSEWWRIKPFGMTVQTTSGERYLDKNYFLGWHHSPDPQHSDQAIYKFSLDRTFFNLIDLLTDSEILITYYYKKESLSYYAKYDNILTGAAYDFIIKDSEGTTILKIGNISSVRGNNITFTENIKNLLGIGEIFTITYDFKTIGGLLETKHMFIEVQPYSMQFYNNYYPFSGASILAPMYYNLSANYQYQMALNYRLQEKSILSFNLEINDIDIINDYITLDLNSNAPLKDESDIPVIIGYYYENNKEMKIFDEHITFNSNIVNISGISSEYGFMDNDTIYISIIPQSYNKYQPFHNLVVDLTNNTIKLTNWEVAQDSENNLIANLESEYFIVDAVRYDSISEGYVKQIYAVLNDTNSLTYYLTQDLDANGWQDFNTLIMKLGILNPDVLDYLKVSFYYGGSNLIGSTNVTVDMIDVDTGTVYIPLPTSGSFNQFTIQNNASIVFQPVFYEFTDFLGFFYRDGLPTYQTVIWDSESVDEGYLNLDLDKQMISRNQSVLVFNEEFEFVYKITDIDIRTQEYEGYEIQFHNISLPATYSVDGKTFIMRNDEVLFLKYNASLEKTIGITVEDMALQRAPYIKNYKTGLDDVPIAEISLLGINNDENTYTIDDIYNNRDKLVAWEAPLDFTPFENTFYNTYSQKIFNISFSDIYSEFKTSDENNIEHSYITDILITSNDPRYEIVVDSFFIFEFDSNATLYDSEIFDIYPQNHMEIFYFGDFSDIYSEVRTLNASEFLPLYTNNNFINETMYFDAFDDDGNYYYFGEHLFGVNTSLGVYNITWNPLYSGEYYDAYVEEKDDLAALFEYYWPHIANYSYLYISWADANAWEEWQTIDQVNVDLNSIDITFEWYDDILEEYQSVVYNQSLGDFKSRQIAIETIWPYNSISQTAIFDLSQNYSNAQNLDILSIKGFFFNTSELDFDPDQQFNPIKNRLRFQHQMDIIWIILKRL
ncbi:hypothetical protein LCGC14_0803060 [marine sediment metagenome]|uniref:Uncharacterized protein n=1 Tax=marine sediment metagenome TaxID=412755 RepID=A0A0F9PTP5_9ZZZZ